MQDELENNQNYYHSLAHEYWCGLLSTIKVKGNSKIAANQVKRLTTSRAESNSNIDESIRVPLKKRVRTGVIPSHKKQEKKTSKHNGI